MFKIKNKIKIKNFFNSTNNTMSGGIIFIVAGLYPKI